MRISVLLCYLALLVSIDSRAIVIRHDVDDKYYRTTIRSFPPLATLYNQGGHGTLIAARWVVTAAHTTFCLDAGYIIRVGEQLVRVKARYSHPDYQLDGNHDIALIELTQDVQGIQPAERYVGTDEQGLLLSIIGTGGTGNGLLGQTITSKQNNGVLRLAENRVVSVDESDLMFIFDRGDQAAKFEGVSGNGDSGGPAFLKKADRVVLYGNSSRTGSWFKNIGEYGVKEIYTRISSHNDWIDQVIQGSAEQRAAISTQQRFLPEAMSNDELKKLCRRIQISAK
jgi:secreted trypsin-like serine protease